MTDGVEVVGGGETDAIPGQIHGFDLRVGIGPYPPDAEHTHRRALYAELTVPEDRRDLAAVMEREGRERILAWVPLTPEGRALIEAEPNGKAAEEVAIDAVRAAEPLARQVAHAAARDVEANALIRAEQKAIEEGRW